MNLLSDDEIPVGLGMALAENVHAMERFGRMTGQERQTFINRSRQVHSKEEMKQLVYSLGRQEDRISNFDR